MTSHEWGRVAEDGTVFVRTPGRERSVGQYKGPPEEALPLLSEHVLPVMEHHPGFRGFWTFRDEGDPGHAVAVSLWANRGTAFAAHERVLEVMTTLRDVFPALPTITAGATRVIAASTEETREKMDRPDL